ncbi:hypothetical protein KPL76_08030 [Subtercola sp. PAMC28395]|uniref:hypothetical protein n=1 Tax=Subtercola sp. PAMC28395 TaxID=2846775 RepID=UPI001C0BC053|nr:hypothetical protein [Subtercola sp. PAMC28395]QWT22758.1 hypothetical protein KPL76_08030 [Subtercola sp. PAMC28395]
MIGAALAASVTLISACSSVASVPTPSQASPAPTPTTPATPLASLTPTVRVPLGCDQVLSQADAEAATGMPMTASPPITFTNPTIYVDQRVGSLECGWQTPTNGPGTPASSVTLLIMPGVTREAFLGEAAGEGWSRATPAPTLGDDVRRGCDPQSADSSGCHYIAFTGEYGITLAVSVAADSPAAAEATASGDALFTGLLTTVAAAPASAPLWQPQGPSLRGARSCDDIISTDTLAAVTESPPLEIYKQEAGEYANSNFNAAAQTSAYFCSWTSQSIAGGAWVSVIPGGASYFEDSKRAYPGLTWELTGGYPGEAYLTTTDGATTVNMLVDNGWIKIVLSDDKAPLLPALAAQVYANVGP